MKTLILDGIFAYKDPDDSFDGKTPLEIIKEKSRVNGFDRFILIQNGNIKKVPENIKNVVINDLSCRNILAVILREAKDTDTVCVFNAANPLYDPEFMDKMLRQHEKYLADYTYSLGYPGGLLPQIINKNIIKELIELVSDSDETREDYLFHAISKDINSFDIETVLSDYDLRIFRISFGLKDAGEEVFTKKMFDFFKTGYTVDAITEYLNSSIDKIYTTIYLVNMEITNRSPVSSIYLPGCDEPETFMDVELAKKIITEAVNENGSIRFVLGGMGEPLVHPGISKIINHITGCNAEAIIETTGYNAECILNDDSIDREKVIFVCKIDCHDEETYGKIHSGFDYRNAIRAHQSLIEKGFRCYRLITRMAENEIEIEKFIRNKETDKLIIRKFSRYCEMLPDKKVVDLSPLERIPCFHLRREINVLPDGKVTPCIYSRYKGAIGDLNNENLGSIIDKMKVLYSNNARKDYMDFCINCDDYYIFNF